MTNDITMNDNNKKKNSPSNPVSAFINWLGVGLYAIFDTILSIIGFAWVGIKNSWRIFSYAIKGLKYIFVTIPSNLFYAASGGVDKAYQTTKDATGKVVETQTSAFKKLSEKITSVSVNMDKLLEKQKILHEELHNSDPKRVETAQVYQYTAKNPRGKIVTDTFTGFSKYDVNSYLVNEGFEVYDIQTSKYINFFYGNSSVFVQKMSNKDLIFWLTQLSTYVKSGIPLTDSVRILANQMSKNKSRKKLFESIVYELTVGESFSVALEKQGKVFPSLLINMLKAAEATGELEETLDDMANYYDETEKTRKQVISAMTYPAIITVFALAVITFIMLYVIPQFMDVYTQVGAEINGLTLAIINISLFLQKNVLYLFLGIVGAILVLYLFYKNIKAFRLQFQTLLMKMPVIGKIMIYKELTIFTKTFASLLKNNVFITESIDILSKVTNNEVYKEIMYNTITNLAKGEKISVAFFDHWAIPDIAYYMIVTGESTGELAEMMTKVSDYFQEMNRNAVNTLKAFIEPIMIVSLALIVGVVILAVIIPMFDLYGTIA